MGKIKDITNLKFGNLTAISNTGKADSHRNLIWLCQCDCGNFCEVSGNNLRTGHTRSCGCLKQIKCAETGKKQNIIDETNNHYGKLTVLSLNSINNHNAMWLCECQCGNKVVVAGTHLRSGHTQSCGCVKSIGEMRINELLTINKINYASQYTVFINDAYYRFDYAIFDNEQNLITLIEFDGEQHFPNNTASNFYDYEATHQRDIIKNKYCIQNNIPLIRIPYWEKDNLTIELILGNKYKIN